MPTVRELREVLAANQATWTVAEWLKDEEVLPHYTTGASTEKLVPAAQVPKLSFAEILAGERANPLLLARRATRGFIPRKAVEDMGLGWALELEEVPLPLARPASLDWRDRWGWSWITGIRDQDGCMACWCFGAVALVEAMVRIEHCLWPSISEGDVHKGMGSLCCDCGSAENALNWIKDHGAADPGCFPWHMTTAGCTGCGGTGGAPYDTIAYTPTSDRPGRTVKIPAYTHVGSVEDQKAWLDTVGPLTVAMTVWTDFMSYGSGVYKKQATLANGQPNKVEGGHVMLVVGYDDTAGCWIIKNSWGTNWGESGYCHFGYGETDIDTWAKAGLRNTNPDPWTKHRLHGGAMIESGNGAWHRNFEMLATTAGNQLRHWWRDGADFSWHDEAPFMHDALVCPTLASSTNNRNFESAYLTLGHRLRYLYYNQSTAAWVDGGLFGPLDAAAVPGFIQSNTGAPGPFEVVIRTVDGQLNHWSRSAGAPWTWTDRGRFGSNIAHSGAALVQSRQGTVGHFELVCVLDNGKMQHWVRNNDAAGPWQAGATFGSCVDSPPCMIEGQYGAQHDNDVGNSELCVAVGGRVQHWWRGHAAGAPWQNSATFGHDVQRVVALVEGSYGFNLEVIVLRTDNMLQHYWRDGAGWHEGVVIGTA
jgi:Papain family cysteine protease